MAEYRTIAREGLWTNNGVLSMMLGLCPTMAMTNSATNGLGMGLATAAVMTASTLLVSLFRNYFSQEVRIPVFVLIIATMVTIVDMCMNAWLHELYKVLGLFIPLIVVNCLPFARFEIFSTKNSALPSMADGFFMGVGFTLALTTIGAVREITGSGTLFADASLLLGPAFKFLEMRVLPADTGILMMILPPGAFLATGLLLVVKRMIDERSSKAVQVSAAAGAA
ncbi:MAG: electron transport complex subunit RsxE [Gallionellales bacterium RIFCSPHIGHO2_02_FULL_57_16]|nr:MAG: electron transport complex subunit RsxE [Gallionellales bacterium RIFCSPHIGHO2_02_FULL_57_16]